MPASRTTAAMPAAAAAARDGRQEHQGDRRPRHTSVPSGAPARVIATQQRLVAAIVRSATAKYRELGTGDQLADFNRFGALPTRTSKRHLRKRRICHRATEHDAARRPGQLRDCTIGCEHIYAAW
jgi:hypothetical protein